MSGKRALNRKLLGAAEAERHQFYGVSFSWGWEHHHHHPSFADAMLAANLQINIFICMVFLLVCISSINDLSFFCYSTHLSSLSLFLS